MDTNLNQRQRLFIHYYAQGMGGRQSAIKAGYKSKNASVVASQNLRKLNIRRALDTLNEEAGITPTRLVSNFSSVLTQIKNIEFRAGDYVKVMEFLLKLNGIYLKPPPSPRRPSRKRYEKNPSIERAFLANEYFKQRAVTQPPSTTHNSSVPVTEPPKIVQEQTEVVLQAIPTIVKKAIPTPASLRQPIPAYSMNGFKDQEVISTVSRINYPA